MDIRKLQRTIVDALEDVKAQDIEVFNTEELTSLFDRVIVASGTSNRQTRALASSVRDSVKAAGFEVRNPEGEETGEWVLVDCGAAVVHIMQPAIRAYYKLEELWGAKPVHLKRAGAAKSASKSAPVAPKGPDASPDKPEPAAKAAARKSPAAKRPAAKKAAAAAASPYGETRSGTKRVTRVVGTAEGSRAAPAPAARKRATAAAAPATKRAPARKTPTASAPAKRPAAKKAVKTVASKVPTKRTTAKKLAS